MLRELLARYDKPVPRYTSYPAVPHWDAEQFGVASWLESLQEAMIRYETLGITLYIHLPYCERLCTYCGCNKHITTNHAVEYPYREAVLSEWEMYRQVFGKKPLLRGIHLGGGTPTFFSAQSLDKLLSGIMNESQVFSADFEGSVEVHPTVTSSEQLEVLHKFGFRRLSAGIQDIDPKVQFIINRVQPKKETIRVIEEARKIGYDQINVDLVYGLPLQTYSSISETLEHVLELLPDRIAYYGYAHVPWKSKGQRRYTEKDLPDAETKRNMYLRAYQVLTSSEYESIGMDHFARSNDALFKARQESRLHRNFMGYTTQHTPVMIGLGASAISDCGSAYSQNYKTPKEYLERISQKQFPIDKGHILTTEDMLIKGHILDLMCYYETRVDDITSKSNWWKRVHQNMAGVIADGLVAISDKDVKISLSGRPFVRNIASCFDPYFNRQLPDSPTFSKSI